MVDKQEAELERFWKYWGFEWEKHGGRWYFQIDSNFGTIYEDLPVLSPNTIFQYCIPKLQKEGYGCRLQSSPIRDNDSGKLISKWTAYANIFPVGYEAGSLLQREYYALHEDVSLAFFEATRPLWDKE